jgi:hypothetical protein
MRRSDAIELMIEVENEFAALADADQRLVRIIDGKPLETSNVSKDRQSGYGRSAGGMHRGYKLHAVWGDGPVPSAWALAPMNVSEKTMARLLIPTLPGGGYLLADTEYDANPLFDIAYQSGFQVVAPKRQKKKGIGHRRQSPSRFRSIELMQTTFGSELFKLRGQIERNFAGLVSFGGGLTCLPAWVRTLHRVRNWVHCKLLINAIRWFQLHQRELIAVA